MSEVHIDSCKWFTISLQIESLSLGLPYYNCPLARELTLNDTGKIGQYLATKHSKVRSSVVV